MAMRKLTIRTCIACRSSSEKKELLRIVRSADGKIEIDPTGKKPGRGAYVCREIECVNAAIKKKALERALRTAVPAGFADELIQVVQDDENADG